MMYFNCNGVFQTATLYFKLQWCISNINVFFKIQRCLSNCNVVFQIHELFNFDGQSYLSLPRLSFCLLMPWECHILQGFHHFYDTPAHFHL